MSAVSMESLNESAASSVIASPSSADSVVNLGGIFNGPLTIVDGASGIPLSQRDFVMEDPVRNHSNPDWRLVLKVGLSVTLLLGTSLVITPVIAKASLASSISAGVIASISILTVLDQYIPPLSCVGEVCKRIDNVLGSAALVLGCWNAIMGSPFNSAVVTTFGTCSFVRSFYAAELSTVKERVSSCFSRCFNRCYNWARS